MTWNAAQAWNHAVYTNGSGDPLFFMPPQTLLSYDQITMPQRMPADPTNVEGGINHRHQAVTTTTRVGPQSGREIRSTPIHVANMYNIASVRMARTFRDHTAAYNERYEVNEAPPLVSLPKQLTERQIQLIVDDVQLNGHTGNLVLTVGSDADSPARMDMLEQKLRDVGVNPFEAIHILHFDNPNLNTPKAFADVTYWRDRYPESYLLAGNTDNPETARYIVESGADAVKIGIGPGAMCTTRIKTGIGIPQASAVAAAVNALKKDDGKKMGHVVADGGIRMPKHWVYALALGADDVMFGSIFGGYAEGFESDADLEAVKIESGEKFYVPVYGSASKTALQTHHADKDSWYKTPEGREAAAILRESSATEVIDDYRGGLRGALTHRGVGSIGEMQETAQFGPISGSHVDHSVHNMEL